MARTAQQIVESTTNEYTITAGDSASDKPPLPTDIHPFSVFKATPSVMYISILFMTSAIVSSHFPRYWFPALTQQNCHVHSLHNI